MINWNALQASYLEEIESTMSQYINTFSPVDSTLKTMSKYHLATGGKRLRALLPIAVAEAFGKDPKTLIPFSCACELLHNATLVHDDLQDGDTTRRGQETIWVKYGIPQAINVGDALLYYAIGALQKLEMEPIIVQTLTSRFVLDTLRVIDGQEREFLLMENAPSLEDYFLMVEGKTSGLFALPFGGAAMLCGANQEQSISIDEASKHLGVIFQIQDDVLDIFANKGRERKGSDIAEGKRSALATYALLHAKEKEKSDLIDVLTRAREDVSDEDVLRITQIFETSGALEFSLQEIQNRVQKVGELLKDSPKLLEVADALIVSFLDPIKEVYL